MKYIKHKKDTKITNSIFPIIINSIVSISKGFSHSFEVFKITLQTYECYNISKNTFSWQNPFKKWVQK